MNAKALIKNFNNPFIGLRSFESEESALFFGRDKQTSELLQKLRQTRFLCIVGTSGCGKSSLVRAGLIPKLKAGFVIQQHDIWNVAIMKPGNDPLFFLAKAIIGTVSKAKNYSESEVHNMAVNLKERILQKKAAAVYEAIQQFEVETNEPANLLLVVDQFEELFDNEIKFKNEAYQPHEVEDHQISFVNLLLELTQQKCSSIFVVMTMRSDFLGHCNRFFGLPETINQGQYLVPRLDREQRREAIDGPIKLFDHKIDMLLLNLLLRDSENTDDELPVLQHVMMRTWVRYQKYPNSNKEIRIDHYNDSGQISGAISKHANEIFENLGPIGEEGTRKLQNAAEIVFKSLIKIDEKGRRIRRPQKLHEVVSLCQSFLDISEVEVWSVINAFRASGNTFLLPYKGNLQPETRIDISHESLIRKWNKLNDEGEEKWISEEYNSANVLKWLGESTKRELLRGADLEAAKRWRKEQKPNIIWASRYAQDFNEVNNYINKSEKRRKYIENTKIIGFALISILIGFVIYESTKTPLRNKIDELEKQYAQDMVTLDSLERVNKLIKNDTILLTDTVRLIGTNKADPIKIIQNRISRTKKVINLGKKSNIKVQANDTEFEKEEKVETVKKQENMNYQNAAKKAEITSINSGTSTSTENSKFSKPNKYRNIKATVDN